jgi:cytochrome c553
MSRLLMLLCLSVSACGIGWPCAAEDSAPVFETDVAPILEAYCWKCHGAEGREADLDLRTLPLIQTGGKTGSALIFGDPEESKLFQMLSTGKMPPQGHLGPTTAHIEIVKDWIASGAAADYLRRKITDEESPKWSDTDREWWAFQRLKRPGVPIVKDVKKVRTPIDAFVLNQLKDRGLRFSPEANRGTLIRRLHFDLIGLPPTPAEVDAFLADDSPESYERLVVRLLSSPHYGERWGRHWLDAAGYVDTIGSDNDADIMEEREGIWKYRDYVVRSFNADKPYSQFLREQLAGDELVDWQNADVFTPEILELLIATGFLRQAADVTYAPELNTADIRQQVIYDTIQIVSNNVLGLTMQCARCHTHKFDPISQADYYRLAALFAPTYHAQRWKHSKERFLYDVSPKQKKQIDAHNSNIDQKVGKINQKIVDERKSFRRKLITEKLKSIPEADRSAAEHAVKTPPEKRNEQQKVLAKKYGPFLKITDEEVTASLDNTAQQKLQSRTAEINQLQESKKTYGKIQALWNLGAPLPTYINRRGDYRTPGPQVEPGVISILNDPKNPIRIPLSEKAGYRRAFVHWLTQPEHPLTARVIVNRVWQQYFARGIVETPDNFGVSGADSTHPELLDWLAVEFVHSRWSFKRLHRLIVTSSVYRQSSRQTQGATSAETVDPENKLLWKMPLRRLESEIIRDRILATSGALNTRQGGPPVRLKPNPDGSVIIDPDALSHPDDNFRRSLYLFSRRNYHLTELNVFDQPVVATNCTRRTTSAVVSQSLLLLNSAFAFEQAELFAFRVRQQAGRDERQRVELSFRLALTRRPTEEEVKLSLKLLTRQAGIYQSQETIDAQQATDKALVNLCQMLINTNEFLYVQ